MSLPTLDSGYQRIGCLTPPSSSDVRINMKASVGKILTAVGAGLGLLAAVAMGLKLKMTLTPGMHEVLVYRELFVASAVVLVVGAIIGRREIRRAAEFATRKELGGPMEPPVVMPETDREIEKR